MTSTYDLVNKRLQSAFDMVVAGADPVLRPSERCDYQANGVMALAKQVGRPPREVADEIVGATPTWATSRAWRSPVPASST